MSQKIPQRPVVLCILDGWGHRESCDSNAICMGKTPNYDRLLREAPHSLIDASGGAVGLPDGQMGNSEVGHMNIGAGRRVLQELPRINAAVADGSLRDNEALQATIAAAKTSGGRAHVMGLLSPGGVHSHQDHIAALLGAFEAAGVPALLHAFLDGRDTPPRSAEGYLSALLEAHPRTEVATVIGRYYAMDRDNRWDRVAKAYDAMVSGEGEKAASATEAVEDSYAADVSDEFVLPTIVAGYAGMADGDVVVMANFRADRAREILQALLETDFEAFARKRRIAFAAALGMAEYSDELAPLMRTIFPPAELHDTLGEVVAGFGGRQLRIAETEKYAHVTFFLNGGREAQFAGEDRILVPSPKVATYDLKPEMSAYEVTDKLVDAIESGGYDLIVCNLANGDMVGHSGKLEAAISAVEALDSCIGRLAEAVERAGGAMIVTADHGNCEEMVDPISGQAHTAHTMNKVPFILVNGPSDVVSLANGALSDIAPSLLDLMSVEQPAAMTGTSLIRRAADRAVAE